MLSPAPDDFALAELRLPTTARRRMAGDLERLAVREPYGSDYVAVAVPRLHAARRPAQGLVLLVNRPSALLDPAHVTLALHGAGELGAHETFRVENPFAQAVAATRGLCDLSASGVALAAGELRALRVVGAPLGHFDAAAAVAQAYDAACGLPYAASFKQLVTGEATQSQPTPGQPTPTPPAQSPTPTQPTAPAPTQPTTPTPPPTTSPTPGPPQCAPCDPEPGYACPDAAAPDICVAGASLARPGRPSDG